MTNVERYRELLREHDKIPIATAASAEHAALYDELDDVWARLTDAERREVDPWAGVRYEVDPGAADLPSPDCEDDQLGLAVAHVFVRRSSR